MQAYCFRFYFLLVTVIIFVKMVYEGFQNVQHQQLMQCPLTLKSKWKMHHHSWKFRSQNVQIFGFVYHDTNGPNDGPVWKNQSFLLNEICTVILWQDCYGKANLRKSYTSTVGKRFPIENVRSLTVRGAVLVCVCGRYQIGRQETEHQSDLESTHGRLWFGRTNIIPW